MASAYLFVMLAVTPSKSREVALIANPEFEADRVAGHRARRLIDGGNPAFSDPFLVMAEDWVPRDARGILIAGSKPSHLCWTARLSTSIAPELRRQFTQSPIAASNFVHAERRCASVELVDRSVNDRWIKAGRLGSGEADGAQGRIALSIVQSPGSAMRSDRRGQSHQCFPSSPLA
jgi:hypothetical protein